jgi:hypothetical protein
VSLNGPVPQFLCGGLALLELSELKRRKGNPWKRGCALSGGLLVRARCGPRCRLAMVVHVELESSAGEAAEDVSSASLHMALSTR